LHEMSVRLYICPPPPSTFHSFLPIPRYHFLSLLYTRRYDALWSVHPDLVEVLCKICPELLGDLFDGMLWHSATVEEDDEVRM
jgi:hypothetical protein